MRVFWGSLLLVKVEDWMTEALAVVSQSFHFLFYENSPLVKGEGRLSG